MAPTQGVNTVAFVNGIFGYTLYNDHNEQQWL